MYKRKDHYHQRAKKEGYVSRAAYKLLEIDKKHRILQPGYRIVDLGCSPGGWLQVAARVIGPSGLLLGVDRTPPAIPANPPLTFIQADIFQEDLASQILDHLGQRANLLLSDLSPDISGIKSIDQHRSFELSQRVLAIGEEILHQGSCCLLKIFEGPETREGFNRMKKMFSRVMRIAPQASRKSSSEIYFLGIGYKKYKAKKP